MNHLAQNKISPDYLKQTLVSLCLAAMLIFQLLFMGQSVAKPAMIQHDWAPHDLILKLTVSRQLTSNCTPAQLVTELSALDTVFQRFHLKKISPILFSQNSETNSVSEKIKNSHHELLFHLTFVDSLDMRWLIPYLESLPQTVYAEPNYYFFAQSRLSKDKRNYPNPTALRKLQIPQAQKHAAHNFNVIIGIVDAKFNGTGTSNFEDSVLPGFNEISDQEIENTQNSSERKTKNRSFSKPDSSQTIYKSNDKTDSQDNRTNFHSAALARIIRDFTTKTQVEQNSNFRLMLFPAGLCDEKNQIRFTATACVNAIIRAIDQETAVLLFGWSSAYSSMLLQEAITHAHQHGCFMVAAAGNSNSSTPHFPAACQHVLAVAATDIHDRKAFYSNFGNWVDVSAPGNSASPKGNLTGGTSVAAATVAGISALILSNEGELTTDALKKQIIYSCENIDSLNVNYDGLLGAGRVNALRALKGFRQPNIVLREIIVQEPVAQTGLAGLEKSHCSFSVTIENIAADAKNVAFELTYRQPGIAPQSAQWFVPQLQFRQSVQNNEQPFLISIDADLSKGTTISCSLKVSVDQKFHKFIPLEIPLNPVPTLPLTITDAQDGKSVFLAWQLEPVPNRTGYEIYRRQDGQESFEKIATIPFGTTWFQDKSCRPNEKYFYYLQGLATTPPATSRSAVDSITIQPFERLQLVPFQILRELPPSARMRAADLNGDAQLDLLLDNSSPKSGIGRQTQIYLANRPGLFRKAKPDTCSAHQSLPADMNFDGALDLWAWNAAGWWYLLLNDGQANFTPDPRIRLAAAPPACGCIHDLNQDGLPDFITNTLNGLTVYLNNGESPNDGTLKFTAQALNIEHKARKILSADLNSDGNDDLILIGATNNQLRIYLNSGTGDFMAVNQAITEAPIHDLLLLNLDENPAIDLVLLENQNSALKNLNVYLNPAFQTGLIPPSYELKNVNSVAAGDIDNDGDFDLVTVQSKSSDQQTLIIAQNDGAGNFNPVNIDLSCPPIAEGLLFDADIDGDLDFLAGFADSRTAQFFINNIAAVKTNPPPQPPQEFSCQIDSTNAELRWQNNKNVEVNRQTLGYKLRIRTDRQFNTIEESAGTSEISDLRFQNSFRLKNIQPRTTYFWAVQTMNASYQHSNWSPIQCFRKKNTAPQIRSFRPLADTTLTAGDTLIFQVSAWDADADSLKFQWFINDSLSQQSGDSTFYYCALSATDTIRLIINDPDTAITTKWCVRSNFINHPPKVDFSKTDTTIAEGDTIVFQPRCFDPDGDSLSFRWKRSGQPDTVFTDSTLCIFADFESAGIDTIQFQICDGDTCVFWQSILRIKDVNRRPEILTTTPLADSSLFYGDSLRFTTTAIDLDGDSLRYSWLVNGKTDSAAHDTLFRYQALLSSGGVDTIQVQVSDADTLVFYNWHIKILQRNVAPKLISCWPDSQFHTISEGDSIQFRVHVYDQNQDTLKYRWFHRDSTFTVQADSIFEYSWDFKAAGTDTIQVQIADNDTLISHQWIFNIRNVNQPPQFVTTSPALDTAIVRGDSVFFEIKISDPDSQPVSVTWFFNGKEDSVCQDSVNYKLLTSHLAAGFDTVTVSISDGDTLAIHQWIIRMISENEPPKITYYWPRNDTGLVEGDTLIFRVRIQNPGNDSLKWNWAVNHRIFQSAGDPSLTYIAQYLNAAMDTIRFSLVSQDSIIQHTWLVKITNINHQPDSPAPVFPLLGETLAESDFLAWTKTNDPDSEDSLLTYFVEIAADTGFQSIVVTQNVKGDTTLQLQPFAEQFQVNQPYFWRVRAFDSHQDTSAVDSSSTNYFYIFKVSAKISNAYANLNVDGSITIFWETSYEHENVGFNVLRQNSEDDHAVQINEALIRGTSPYFFLDTKIEAGQTYFYQVESVSIYGARYRHEKIQATAPVPESFELHQNYPNPLTFETIIRYQIPRNCLVKLFVYNILGKSVRNLVNQKQEKGFFNVVWNGRDDDGKEVGSGIYFYSIIAENFHETRKILVVR